MNFFRFSTQGKLGNNIYFYDSNRNFLQGGVRMCLITKKALHIMIT